MNDETRTVTLNHRNHTFMKLSTGHIYNVDAVNTHDLVKCACGGFFGWVPKGVI